jgi:hypothetical protein
MLRDSADRFMHVVIERHQDGPRFWINDTYRVHHWLAGLALVAIGAALMIHDRQDWHDALLLR